MKSDWIAWCVALLSAPLLPACSRPPPSSPRLHSLSGHLRLTGYLVANDGHFAGTRVVGDADGVPVELSYGDQVVARTSARDGIYRFSGLGAGAYVARTRLIGGIVDETELLTISNSDVQVADTLRLASRGDILPVPNPIGQTTTSFYFELPDTEWAEVDILDLSGGTVRGLVARRLPAGLNRVDWDGYDAEGHPATAALFWATLVAGEDVRAQLLFR